MRWLENFECCYPLLVIVILLMLVTAATIFVSTIQNSLLYHSRSRMLFANSHTGPSGTVKLAKKEPAAKPAASSTKEKKPAAKVHFLAHTFIQKSD